MAGLAKVPGPAALTFILVANLVLISSFVRPTHATFDFEPGTVPFSTATLCSGFEFRIEEANATSISVASPLFFFFLSRIK